MKYITSSIFVAAVVIVMAAPAFTFALETSDGGVTASVVTAPGTTDNGTTAGASSAPGTQDNGSTAGTQGGLATQDNGTTAGTPTVPGTTDNGTTAGAPNNETGGTISGPGNTTGGGTGYTGGGSSGGSLPALITIAQCQYIASYMKFGGNNSSSEVLKLQSFLKNTEGMNVNPTGTFDQMTLNAVNAFQAKYLSEIMLPWGATTPSGYVYITTSKKINEIFCKKNFTLTRAQLAEIEAYRTSPKSIKAPSTTVGGEIGIGTKPTPSANPATGEVSTTSTQTAAVAKTPVFSKVWEFVKRIFGR